MAPKKNTLVYFIYTSPFSLMGTQSHLDHSPLLNFIFTTSLCVRLSGKCVTSPSSSHELPEQRELNLSLLNLHNHYLKLALIYHLCTHLALKNLISIFFKCRGVFLTRIWIAVPVRNVHLDISSLYINLKNNLSIFFKYIQVSRLIFEILGNASIQNMNIFRNIWKKWEAF